MLITVSQSGLWTRIVRNDGMREWQEWLPNNEAQDLYYALHALFQVQPALEPSESNSDA